MSQDKTLSPLTINGFQLRDALELIAPDSTDEQLESEVCIQRGPERTHDEGTDAAGVYCWLSDYPEEGSIRLDDAPAAHLKRTGQSVTNDAATMARIDSARLDGMRAGWNLAIAGEDAKYDATVLALVDSVTTLRKEARATPPEAVTAEAVGKVPASVPSEVFKDTLAHLVGAASAYRRFAKRHPSQGKAETDALFSTRAEDFDKAVERGRAALSAQPRSAT